MTYIKIAIYIPNLKISRIISIQYTQYLKENLMDSHNVRKIGPKIYNNNKKQKETESNKKFNCEK